MLDIRINNESLDLGKYSITFELTSPIFNDVGSFSYPFTIPATPKNKRVLNVPGRIAKNKKTVKKVDSSIYLKNLLWNNGKLVVTEANSDYIKVYFTVTEGYFYQVINDLFLNEIDLGGIRDINDYGGNTYDDLFRNVYTNNYPDADFAVFPIKNDHFYESELKSTIANYHPFINYFDVENNRMPINNNTLIPFIYVNYLFKRLTTHLDIALEYSDLLIDSELSQIVLFSNNPMVDYHFDLSGNLVFSRKEFFDLKNYLPKVTFKNLIKHLENTFSSYFFYNSRNNILQVRLLKNILNQAPTTLNCPYKHIGIEPNEYNGYTVDWENENNDDFIEKYARSLTGLNFKGTIESKNLLPSLGNQLNDLYFVNNPGLFYRWRNSEYFNSTDWYIHSLPYTKIVSGNAKKEIRPPGSFLNWVRIPPFKRYPESSMKGNTLILEDDEYEDYSVRFLFNRGFINDEPYGTPGSTDQYGNDIFNYSIQWHGSTGLYENFWKIPLQFYSKTRKAEFIMLLQPASLKGIDFSRKYRFAESNWLLSKIKLTASPGKISPSYVTAFKV